MRNQSGPRDVSPYAVTRNEHEIITGGRRPRLRRAHLVVLTAIAAATVAVLAIADHHSSPKALPEPTQVVAGPPVCGRDLLRAPQSGQGPLDGGLLVTQAQIPPITRPAFETAAAARRWLPADAPVVVVRVDRDVRAYPLAILQWHEVVDDRVGGRPVAVTYCPLCNTAIVYSRVVAGHAVLLQSSGALLLGSAVLVDPATRLLWSQVSGAALPNFGQIASTPLAWLPSDTLDLATAAAAYPRIRVLARPSQGFDYTSSPYGHVADLHSLPQLYLGWVDEQLPPKAHIVGVTVHGVAAAWRYSALRRVEVHNDRVGAVPVVVVYRAHVTGIGDSDDLRQAVQTGSAAVFSARVAGRVLHFTTRGENALRDRETGTLWDLTGRAVAGRLAGARLEPLPFVNTYWFAWYAFHPDTTVWPAITASTCSQR